MKSPNAAKQREPANLSFYAQLCAAIERHEECDNWATLDSVLIAAKALAGDELCQSILKTEDAWRLDADGRLPA